ncbi:MAG: GH36-type glycosyl hydrolase domain-containing protein, partial [Brevefilum sp.]
DYASVSAKQERLWLYFDRVSGHLSGEKVALPLKTIAADLAAKADWLKKLIREQEWLADGDRGGWFNGYYDNDGQRVEGTFTEGVRMTLTGQVFPLMAGVATAGQAQAVMQAADAHLYDQNLNGHRLNTHFGANPPRLGRAFGFAYGHKENGALFSHMAVMYAYALYCQGLAAAAWGVLDGLYTQSQDFSRSRMYPGIPEYFNPRGRGMYPYLTGSAAWYLYTLLTESFGVKGALGDLCLAPKLVGEQFARADNVRVETVFAGKKLTVTYHNPQRLTYGEYCFESVSVNGTRHDPRPGAVEVRFTRAEVLAWPDDVEIVVHLTAKSG